MEEEIIQFDLEKVHRLFSNSIKEVDDIILDLYLEAFKELNKFFLSMGGLFGFVSDEMLSKIAILDKLIESSKVHVNNYSTDGNMDQVSNGEVISDQEPFKSVVSMIDYEKSNGLLKKKDYVSGCRTLLRLHRGLDFIRVFLNDLSLLDAEASTASCCRSAYDRTLAKYHSWFIRTGASLAILTMPKRHELLIRVCGTDENIESTLRILPDTLSITSQVYDRVQNLFHQHQLLNLD